MQIDCANVYNLRRFNRGTCVAYISLTVNIFNIRYTQHIQSFNNRSKDNSVSYSQHLVPQA